jgi:streptogramin lyase
MILRADIRNLFRLLLISLLALLLAGSPAEAAKPRPSHGRLVGTLAEAAHPEWLTVGGDGTVWYSGYHTRFYGTPPGALSYEGKNPAGPFIGHIAPGGTASETTLPEGDTAGQPVAIPGGDVWYPESHQDAAGEAAFEVVGFSAAGETQSYPVGSGVTRIEAMTTLDGDLWFAGSALLAGVQRGVIGEVALTAAGAVTLHPLEPGCGAGEAITATSDAIWFGEDCLRAGGEGTKQAASSSLGRIAPSGQVSRQALPAGDRPVAVAANSDGSVWVGMRNSDYRKPTPLVHFRSGRPPQRLRVPGARFYGMAIGPEGRLWFPSLFSPISYNGIASIGPGGKRSRPTCAVKMRGCGIEVDALEPGPGGKLWFTAGAAYLLYHGGGGETGLLENIDQERSPGYIGYLR